MKKKILVVDDEVAFALNVVKTFLEETGAYEVRVETSGVKALPAAREFKPDLVLLDVMMRDVAGPRIANEIKADPKLKTTPIVYLTATVKDDLEGGTYDGEINGLPFLAKPVKLERLIECVKASIRD